MNQTIKYGLLHLDIVSVELPATRLEVSQANLLGLIANQVWELV